MRQGNPGKNILQKNKYQPIQETFVNIEVVLIPVQIPQVALATSYYHRSGRSMQADLWDPDFENILQRSWLTKTEAQQHHISTEIN